MFDCVLNMPLADIGRKSSLLKKKKKIKKSLTLHRKRQEKNCYCIQRRI